ncbi:type IV pilus modification protein PilV [Kineobactrum salinum]|uniref:Type IV pilus modification protein PilV n=1 Tax=Kineobactrum salinum TaxID=2708301 RepID=A0A6C0U5Z7_9GAMM|nr:type IV pilus modification protein PilV [Kineobactrum salinum]QIB66357.1 type IV pilus modification protein PilV [Kineobactrum salinum]
MNAVGVPVNARGITLIEVLITLLIVAIGLLGLAGLQVTTISSQFEAYQRAQAVLLLEDMANRIRVNAPAARAGNYPDGDSYGLGVDPENIPDCSIEATTQARDLCEWGNALAGVDVLRDSQGLGSIIGARGCIENLAGSADGEGVVRVSIAWQGSVPTVAPANLCGKDAFGADDRIRRVVSVDVVLAFLGL